MALKLYSVQLSLIREGLKTEYQNVTGFYTCGNEAEALGLAIRDITIKYPDYKMIPNSNVTDISLLARQYVLMNPVEQVNEDHTKAGT